MRNIKLKNQIILLVVISMATLMFVQIAYFIFISQSNERNEHSILVGTLEHTAKSIDRYLDKMNSVVREFAYSELLRDYTDSGEPFSDIAQVGRIKVLARAVMMADDTLESVLLTDLNRLLIGNISNSDFTMLDKLVRSGVRGKLTVGESYLIYYRDGNTTKGVCILPVWQSTLNMPLYALVRFGDSYLVNVQSQHSFTDRLTVRVSNDSISVPAAYTAATPAGAHHVTSRYGWEVEGRLTGGHAAMRGYYAYSCIVTLGTMAILILISITIYTNITKPITHISRFMDSYGKTYNHTRIELKNQNEVGALASAVNMMLDDIDRMTAGIVETQGKLYQSEITEKQARLGALQTQMNPHFLSNTLECLRGMALVYNAGPIVQIVSSMSSILRYNLSEQSIVKLGDEIDCILDYMRIVNLRKGNIYDIVIEIGQEYLQFNILKMLIQPIIENAVLHGLEERPGPGRIEMTAVADGGDLLIRIADNGVGLPPGRLRALCESLNADMSPGIVSGGGLGLINVHRRLLLTYGPEYGLDIVSSRDAGTNVTIRIPMETGQASLDGTGYGGVSRDFNRRRTVDAEEP